ncbi:MULTISPECIES: hydroxymethylbilane synthase [Halolamina]|uniref:Hydroxymethylbilane synthase n=1 Tax=Halolamina pelagica TaxID=699431 RepID=A0A1I5RM81_9EURY|nr:MULTISPECIES: hydroxymethylbilane synthase [Halolamina]NHX35256.1 hydroxymethylbilane synthase [Halolamina sp. R1-12]SFP59668.1 hydroxymethylbilane synthase [Halolamina pelagica]
MSTDRTLRLATRGSDLAMRQAAFVQERVSTRRRPVELVEIETEGDRIRDELIADLGRIGAFVHALDQEVVDGDCDAAVHSMKDMPTEFAEGMVVAAVPERAAAGDLLVTEDGKALEDLHEGAVVGTASLRRTAQLLHARPDLDVRPLRGNVDSRIEKLLAPRLQREHERRMDADEEETSKEMREYNVDPEGVLDDENEDLDDLEDDDDEFDRTVEEWFDGLSELERGALGREYDHEYDALVLAEAGLERSGLRHKIGTSRLPMEEFVPSPAQGAIAVTARDEDTVGRLRQKLDHAPTRVAVTVERTVLAELGGGCVAPLGVHATVQGDTVSVRAQVLSTDGTEVVEDARDLPIENHVIAAESFAADLADRGAADLIAAAADE